MAVKQTKTPTMTVTDKYVSAVQASYKAWNKENPDRPFANGMNWNSVGNEMFEKFLNNYLFPKLDETSLIEFIIPDRFDPWTIDSNLIAQFKEEYTYTDIVPTLVRLDDDEMLNLRRNYPAMRTKLYGAGNKYKYKFTLNDNENRLSWLTIDDAIKAFHGIYQNAINGFNMFNEQSKLALCVDYMLKHVKDTTKADSLDDLVHKTMLKLLNLQSRSTKHNEADHASGDVLTQKTSASNIKDIALITDDEVKLYILESVIANTFQISGLDITSQIMSFEDLGGAWELTESVTISEANTIAKFSAMGFWDKRNGVGMTIPKGSVLTFDVSQLAEFKDKAKELKPQSEHCVMGFDVNSFRFRRNTKNMLSRGLELQESEDYNHFIRMLVNNNISPFFNKFFIYMNDLDVADNDYVKEAAA